MRFSTSIAAAVLSALSLTACTSDRGGAESVQALNERLEKAVAVRDYWAIVQCHKPSDRTLAVANFVCVACRIASDPDLSEETGKKARADLVAIFEHCDIAGAGVPDFRAMDLTEQNRDERLRGLAQGYLNNVKLAVLVRRLKGLVDRLDEAEGYEPDREEVLVERMGVLVLREQVQVTRQGDRYYVQRVQ